VHGCNASNSVWRLAQLRDDGSGDLDTAKGGYSNAWGDGCVWRSGDGRVLPRASVKRAFPVAWRLKSDAEYGHLPPVGQALSASSSVSTAAAAVAGAAAVLSSRQMATRDDRAGERFFGLSPKRPRQDGPDRSRHGGVAANVSAPVDNEATAAPVAEDWGRNSSGDSGVGRGGGGEDGILRFGVSADYSQGHKVILIGGPSSGDKDGLDESGLGSANVGFGDGGVDSGNHSGSDGSSFEAPLGSAADAPLRATVDAALAKVASRLRRPLDEDERAVLRSAEVLLWSYVAPLDALSTRMLRETAEPLATGAAGAAGRAVAGEAMEAVVGEAAAATAAAGPGDEEDTGGGNDDGESSSNGESDYESSRDGGSGRRKATGQRRRRPRTGGAAAGGAGRGLPKRAVRAKAPSPSSDKAAAAGQPAPPREAVGTVREDAPEQWLDGLVSRGYFDLVPRHLARGLNVACGRAATHVDWGSGGCTVTTVPTRRRRRQRAATPAAAGAWARDLHCSGNEDIDDEGGEDEVTLECDFVVVALPLGVLKGRHAASAVEWDPPLPPRKLEAFARIGFGAENKVVLRFAACFWEADEPYLQTTDERFRILNGLCFGKGATLVFHCSPPFGNGYGGLTEDAAVVREAVACLRGMYGPASVAEPVFWHVTRWDKDPFSMGAYSFWATGMQLKHVTDAARPEPDCSSDVGSSGGGTSGGGTNGAALAPPRLFFCGEHTTIRDAQCVHGACNSGERAARQVACAALGRLVALDACVTAGESFWCASESNAETHKIATARALFMQLLSDDRS